MRRQLYTVTAALLLLALTNYRNVIPQVTDIKYIKPALMIGIDRAEDGQGVTVSLLLHTDGNTNSSMDTGVAVSSNSGDSTNSSFVHGTAKTVLMALERIRQSTPYAIPTSSIECFIIGEGAVTDDLEHYIDYLSKDNDLRLTSRLFFTKNATAKDIIASINQTEAGQALDAFGINSGITAISYKLEFITFWETRFEARTCAVPVLTLAGSDDKVHAQADGYAIINNGQFAGYLGTDIARAYNLLTNKPLHSYIECELPQGTVATVLEHAKTNVQFQWDGDTLEKIILTARVTANPQEVMGRTSMDPDTVAFINMAQSDVLRRECEATIQFAQETASDFLGIGKQLRLKHPYRWDKLQANWPDTLAQTPIEIQVQARLQHVFDMQ